MPYLDFGKFFLSFFQWSSYSLYIAAVWLNESFWGLKQASKHLKNVAEMFERKKPSSATTSIISNASPLSAAVSLISVASTSSATRSTISFASPLSATTSAVSKKQWFNNVSELGDVPHQPKKKFLSREFGKKEIAKCFFQNDWFVPHLWIHYDERDKW